MSPHRATSKHLRLASSLLAWVASATTVLAQSQAPTEATPNPAENDPIDATPVDPAAADVTVTPAPTDERSAATLAALPGSDKSNPLYYAMIPEGKTLPAGVARVRIPMRFATGDYGYDQKGKKLDLGVDVNVTGTGLVLEYGLTDRISTQILLPYVAKNELGLDANKFRTSAKYKEKVAEFKSAVAGVMQASRLCADTARCLALIETGYHLPKDTEIKLPSGEPLVIKAGVPVTSYADSLVTTAAVPESGRTGLGDIELGVLYEVVHTGPVRFSAGLGLRLPTGSFDDVPSAQRPTGRGTTDLGLRLNVDYNVVPGVIISGQNQSEQMLTKAEKPVTSLLNASETTGKKVDFERRGLRNIGFVKAAWSLGTITPDLRWLGTAAFYNWDLGATEYLDHKRVGDASRATSYTLNLTVSGLSYGIPVAVEYDRTTPIGGKNVALATTINAVTVKGYLRF